jgi:hypothetical protein
MPKLPLIFYALLRPFTVFYALLRLKFFTQITPEPPLPLPLDPDLDLALDRSPLRKGKEASRLGVCIHFLSPTFLGALYRLIVFCL